MTSFVTPERGSNDPPAEPGDLRGAPRSSPLHWPKPSPAPLLDAQAPFAAGTRPGRRAGAEEEARPRAEAQEGAGRPHATCSDFTVLNIKRF